MHKHVIHPELFKGPIILLNGPPGCGKDNFAETISHEFNVEHKEFKEKLFEIAIVIASVTKQEWFERYDNRELKELPWDKLNGLSQRQFLIELMEGFIKPRFGKTYISKMAKVFIDSFYSDAVAVIYSDCGFIEETTAFDPDRTFLIRIHRDGHTFAKDSRSYVYNEKIRSYDLYNNGTLDEYHQIMKLLFMNIVFGAAMMNGYSINNASYLKVSRPNDRFISPKG